MAIFPFFYNCDILIKYEKESIDIIFNNIFFIFGQKFAQALF